MPADWSIRALEDIGHCLIGLTYDPKNIDSDGVLVLRSSNISDNSLQFEDNIYVEMKIPDRIIVREDDLLICVRNGSRALIGKCALVQGSAVGMTFGAFMSVFRSTDSRFVFYCFHSDIITRQIHEHLGATINQITNKSLNSFKIPYPKTEEREAIAELLSDVDGLLGALEALIAKKRAIKQAAMQQLLTGKTRLPGFTAGWRKVRLGDVTVAQQGGTPPKSRAAYWEGNIPFVTGADLSEFSISRDHARSFLTVEGLNSGATVICDPGALLLATRTRVGLVSIASETMGASQDITLLKPNDLIESPYLCRALMSQAYLLLQRARGTTIQGISRGEVDSIPILLPSRPEQRAIATVLSDMDSEIAGLERRRDKIGAIKQGMMQELLTGRVRLVGPDAPAEASSC